MLIPFLARSATHEARAQRTALEDTAQSSRATQAAEQRPAWRRLTAQCRRQKTAGSGVPGPGRCCPRLCVCVYVYSQVWRPGPRKVLSTPDLESLRNTNHLPHKSRSLQAGVARVLLCSAVWARLASNATHTKSAMTGRASSAMAGRASKGAQTCVCAIPTVASLGTHAMAHKQFVQKTHSQRVMLCSLATVESAGTSQTEICHALHFM